MRILFGSKGNYHGMMDWLRKTMNPEYTKTLNELGDLGVMALSASTPRDTGATAAGWQYRVHITKNFGEVYWYNVAHPHTSISVAKLIEYGHGTRTGGYVPPRPYIRPAMSPIYDVASRLLEREVTHG